MDSITVTDSTNGAKKSIFLAPAGLLATVGIVADGLMNVRSGKLEVTPSAAGRFVATDDAGCEIGRYDVTVVAPASAAPKTTTTVRTGSRFGNVRVNTTLTERQQRERSYDLINNEGAEGYNPHRSGDVPTYR